MKKQTIAVDVDDVLVPHGMILMEYIAQALGVEADDEQFKSADELVLAHGKTVKEVEEVAHELLRSDVFRDMQPFEGAINGINRLNEHYELEIVTARPGIVHQITKEWLLAHFPDVFKQVTFANTDWGWGNSPQVTKLNACEQLGAEYLIDDSLRHIQEVAACGIQGVLFGEYPWNQCEELPKNAVRALNWNEVLNILLPE